MTILLKMTIDVSPTNAYFVRTEIQDQIIRKNWHQKTLTTIQRWKRKQSYWVQRD